MCGIAGLVSTRLDRWESRTMERMLSTLVRRGPDADGQHAWPNALFGHRRLAILDLSDRGRQPMVSPDGAIGVVFNGAIYNYLELREELQRAGFTFQSRTDTEVLVNGYQAWGIDRLVDRLTGMFAFGLWDDRRQELFLVRDRLGVKPLAWCEYEDTLGFASTVAALSVDSWGREMNEIAVADFLEWGAVPEQRSIFDGIQKLPPATILRWHKGKVVTRRYWEPPLPADAYAAIDFEDALAETERLFLEAVGRRTKADVRIGALLSGGIDSALVCWGLREVGADVTAYTFAAPGQPEDESADALLTARELGITLEVLEDTDAGDDWLELADAYAEPFACGSALGMLRLSRVVKESATVLLTGDGGDDVFLGYPHHRYLYAAQRLAAWIPTPLAEAGVRWGLATPAQGAGRRPRNYCSYVVGGLSAFLRVRNSFRFLADNDLLGPRLRGVQPSSHQLAQDSASGKTVLTDYLEYARSHQFVAEYMAKVDGATMYHGLEARSPFLDHHLWEFASSLPFATRLQGGHLKSLLRELARRRIGKRVAGGRKRGFEVPVSSWLRERWKQHAIEVLDSSAIISSGWLDTGRLINVLRGTEIAPLPVWHAVALANWLDARQRSPLTPLLQVH